MRWTGGLILNGSACALKYRGEVTLLLRLTLQCLFCGWLTRQHSSLATGKGRVVSFQVELPRFLPFSNILSHHFQTKLMPRDVQCCERPGLGHPSWQALLCRKMRCQSPAGCRQQQSLWHVWGAARAIRYVAVFNNPPRGKMFSGSCSLLLCWGVTGELSSWI